MLKTTIKLENINLEENKDLLEIINKINDEIKVEFKITLDEVVDMFYYYVKHTAEHIRDIESYKCICPEIIDKYNDGEYYFTLNSIDDEDSLSDINFLCNELKRHFGVNFKKDCNVRELFRILLMDCSDYDIIDNLLKFNLYYKTYNESWIKNFLEQKSY